MTIEKEAREIALKHCGNVADYLGPDLESQMGIYLAEDIAKALQKKQDRIEELEKGVGIYQALADEHRRSFELELEENTDLQKRISELESALKIIADAKCFADWEGADNLSLIAKKAIGGGK